MRSIVWRPTATSITGITHARAPYRYRSAMPDADDETLAQHFAVESGMLSEDDALHHDERNLVSNVVGDEQMRIELGPPLKLARQQ